MNLPDSSFCPHNAIEVEAHDVADNIRRFADGSFKGMIWCQHHGPLTQVAQTVDTFSEQFLSQIDNRTAPPPPSMYSSSSAAPMAEEYLMQLTYEAVHDEYAHHMFTKSMILSECQHHGLPTQVAPTTDTFLEQFFSQIDNCTAPSPPSICSSSSAAPMAEEYLIQPTYDAVHVSNFGFVGDMLGNHAYCPPSSGGYVCAILEDDSLENEEDAFTHCEPSGVADHYHPPIVSGDMMSIDSSPPLVFTCVHYIGRRPCGRLIEGSLDDAYEHFERVHIRPVVARSTSTERWTCRWDGLCGSNMCTDSFKRHVGAHLVRWRCSNCTKTYSRDDTARKHSRECGNGVIIMIPQVGVVQV